MEIKPYERNAKLHPKDQIKGIANSIEHFGCKQPIVVTSEGVIIVGHGRYIAMQDLGYEELKEATSSKKGEKFIPYVVADDLTEEEVNAYRLADNRLNESKWDMDLVEIEFDNLGLEMQSLTGFDIESIKDDTYSKKIKSPIYEAREEKPLLEELVNTEKADELQKQIKASKLPKDEKEFLMKASARLYEFNYSKIADYYAQSDEAQDLMEKLALVIIDYDKAIENGFVQLTQFLMSVETDEG